MGTLIRLPRSIPDEPGGDPYLDLLEMMIIRQVISCFEAQPQASLDSARDLATLREAYLNRCAPENRPPIIDSVEYLEYVTQALSTLTPMGRARIRHPACSRSQAQQFIRSRR